MGAALCLVVGAPALATTVRPPTPSEPEKPATILYYIVGVVLAGAAVGIAVMPSKRGHHD